MPDTKSVQALIAELNDALALLEEVTGSHASDATLDVPALTQCIEQYGQAVQDVPGPAPVRMLHHFACTGGTLMSKLVATAPNTLLLSEIDPLSNIIVGKKQNAIFAPTDLIYGMRVALRQADQEGVLRVFRAGLRALHAHTQEQGQALVLRDHTHSHFCTEVDYNARPSLREIALQDGPVLSSVTVRHPVDSFLSLSRNNWRHFAPFTLQEYALRYLAFLDRHADQPVTRYEDLIDDPIPQLNKMCDDLALPYPEDAEALLPVVAMSGDSGRSGNTISKRTRAALPQDILTEIPQSPAYVDLCQRLRYDARPEAA